MDYLIQAEEVLANRKNYVVIDCRKKEEYEHSHVEDAIWLPIDHWLKENNAEGIARGENVISLFHFISLMSRLGISNDTKVVLYDDNQGRASARFWFVAKHYGHKHVYVLNGGWKGCSNLPISTTLTQQIPFSYYEPTQTDGYIVSLVDLLKDYDNLKIIDVRTDDEWTGKDLHGNPRGGHLFGSVHLNYEDLVSKDTSNTFVNTDEIVSKLESRGIKKGDKIVTYCQAGVRASIVGLALKVAGFTNVALYDGSMYQWSRCFALRLESEYLH